jgi:hypothetical protein
MKGDNMGNVFLVVAAVLFLIDAIWHKSLVSAGLFFLVLSMGAF